MTDEEFGISLENGHLRSKKLLLRKKAEYAAIHEDRLIQFYKLALITNTTAQASLMQLAAKHFSSLCDMAANPGNYSKQQWREKITDLRNYTHLLDGLMEAFWDE